MTDAGSTTIFAEGARERIQMLTDSVARWRRNGPQAAHHHKEYHRWSWQPLTGRESIGMPRVRGPVLPGRRLHHDLLLREDATVLAPDSEPVQGRHAIQEFQKAACKAAQRTGMKRTINVRHVERTGGSAWHSTAEPGLWGVPGARWVYGQCQR